MNINEKWKKHKSDEKNLETADATVFSIFLFLWYKKNLNKKSELYSFQSITIGFHHCWVIISREKGCFLEKWRIKKKELGKRPLKKLHGLGTSALGITIGV